MDIPTSGAVFTLGKSHLADNSQSYFYIKNDPIKKVVSGSNQSAVICESGRLFVWGENNYGQLGIGGASNGDIISRPTCVKSLKSLGLRISAISFGIDWSAILTDTNEIFFAGKSIFPPNSKCAHNFAKTAIEQEEVDISRKPFRLDGFDGILAADEAFADICSGYQHFVLLTSFGRVFGWGNNSQNQLGTNDSELLQPVEIELRNKIVQTTCGPNSTLLLAENNDIFITGHLTDFHYEKFIQLEVPLEQPSQYIEYMHISLSNEIFLITDLGSIYRGAESKRHSNLVFQQFYDYDNGEYGQIRKLLKGSSFFAALTRGNKFYTTFSESGHHLKTFREISKFKNLRTFEMTVGEQHILVLGVPKNGHLIDANGNLGRSAVGLQTLTEEEDAHNGNESEKMRPNTPEETSQIHAESTKPNDLESTTELKKEDEAERSKPNDFERTTELEKVDNAHLQIEEKEGSNLEIVHESEDFAQKIEEEEVKEVENNENVEVIENTSVITDEIIIKTPDPPQIDDNQAEKQEHLEEIASEDKNPDILTLNEETSSPSLSELLSTSTLVENRALTALKKSPTLSTKSRKGSAKSIKFDQSSLRSTHSSSERIVRPRTPFPDSASSVSTPQTVKEVSREIDEESSAFSDSLENVSDEASTRRPSLKYMDRNLMSKDRLDGIARKLSGDAENHTNQLDLPGNEDEEDDELRIEIKSRDGTANGNEIRFIDNGVDVTDNVKGGSLKETPENIDFNTIENDETPDAREEDERTTASVNSAVTSPNVFENENDIVPDTPEAKVPIPEEEASNENVNTERSSMQRFLDEVKSKRRAMGCQSSKAVRIEDEPPKYTPVDEHLENQRNTSKVCTIL